MASPDDVSKAVSRLEAALERIAAARRRPAGDPASPELAQRLDALIEQLRAALAAAG